jgi:uncharacterized damage-inducible protein DinB
MGRVHSAANHRSLPGSRCSALILLLVAVFGSSGPLRATEADRDSAYLKALVSNLKEVSRKVISLAEAIPADKYSWSPSPGVRTVSEVLMHIVGGNLQLPPGLGAAPPEAVDPSHLSVWGLKQQRRRWEEEIVTKEEVAETLSQSLDYALEAIPTITDLDEQVAVWGFPASKRDYLLLLVTHAHEHLGQTIAYARALGITPPWSLRPKPAIVKSTAAFDAGAAMGKILSIDAFGNLHTSFVAADLEVLRLSTGQQIEIGTCGSTGRALLGNELFDVRPGEWVAFISPDGMLTVARSYASAAQELDCHPGASATLSKVAD